MDALVALIAVGGFGVLVWLFSRWSRHRSDEIDGYFGREDHSDPPASDISSWPGGRGV